MSVRRLDLSKQGPAALRQENCRREGGILNFGGWTLLLKCLTTDRIVFLGTEALSSLPIIIHHVTTGGRRGTDAGGQQGR